MDFFFIIYMRKVKVDTEKPGFKLSEVYQVCTPDPKHHGMWVSNDYGDPVFLADDEIEEELEDEQ